jgi:hypothetical protein
MNKSTKLIIKKYGAEQCETARKLFEEKGMNAQSIGHCMRVNTNTAAALVNAGKEKQKN